MAKRSLDDRIAELEEKARSLKARKAKTDRAVDTRRKIVLGALVVRELDANGETAQFLRKWLAKELPSHLSRDNDRAIFSDILTDAQKSDHD